MIKEYYNFIKDYLKLAEIKPLYIFINVLTAFFYKLFELLLPLFGSLIVKYLTESNSKMTYIMLFTFAMCYLLEEIFLYFNYKVYYSNLSYCYDNLTNKIFNKLISVDSNFTRTFSKGRIMNTINDDVITIGDMNDRISEVITGFLQVITVLVIVGYYNIFISLTLIVFAFVYIIVRNKADRNNNIYYNKTVSSDDKYSTLLTQIVSGLQEIKTFNMIDKLKSKLESQQTRFKKNYYKTVDYETQRDNDVNFITYGFRYVLYLLLLGLYVLNKINLSIIILAISYHESLVKYINYFIESTAAIRLGNTSVRRINDLLDYKSNEIEFGNLEMDDGYSSLEFKNVSLIIKNKAILKNINLKINHDEVIAIVGEAGAGKTMLLDLLLRHFEPTEGKILMDNINIFSYDKDTYTNNIGVVNQKPFIFNMSIRNNLNLVETNKTKQEEACKKAGIHDFIMTLPKGYNTILRENGSNISGGQKQMISIARTLLTDAEILLLDDITTSLDPDTAKLVPDLIKNIRNDHTIIMITKKPDLMKIADRIVVLDKGKINDVGTHQELLKRNEIYQSLQARKSVSRMGVFNND